MQTKLNHYCNESDSPRWVVGNTTTGVVTRNVARASGELTATTSKTGDRILQLTNIHGDVSMMLPLDSGAAPLALDSDEYGSVRAGQEDVRYGWLGGKPRSSETLTNLTLMGSGSTTPAPGASSRSTHSSAAARTSTATPATRSASSTSTARRGSARPCKLEGNDPKCTGMVGGAGSGKTKSGAEKAAKKDASSHSPKAAV